MNNAQKLFHLGQSVWYDNIQRSILKNGKLAGMIDRGEIYGVTSNPSIFMNAITTTSDYEKDLAQHKGENALETFFSLAIEDIQEAADLFMPLYHQTNGGDGYVSLEVSPYLAYDTESTINQAQQLWDRVDRPNLMIKIPATPQGIPAITRAIAAGINVNITLIFSLVRYAAVMDAYLSGLEQRLAQSLDISAIASVASFFVSRVDSSVDKRLETIFLQQGIGNSRDLLGRTAIANARLAYADFNEVISSDRFLKLQSRGAQIQRPLWASTSTKNPAYRDVLYVEELIGSHTVNTIPPKTLNAFLAHGNVRPSLGENLLEAHQVMEDIASLGINIDEVTQQLENEGVAAFSAAFDTLLANIDSLINL